MVLTLFFCTRMYRAMQTYLFPSGIQLYWAFLSKYIDLGFMGATTWPHVYADCLTGQTRLVPEMIGNGGNYDQTHEWCLNISKNMVTTPQPKKKHKKTQLYPDSRIGFYLFIHVPKLFLGMFQNSSPSQFSQILWVPSCNWSQKAPQVSSAGSTGRAQRNEGNEVVEVEAQPRSSAREVGPGRLGWATINGSINKTKLWDYKI
jgi:hypothetical protein